MSKEWVRLSAVGTPRCNEIEATIDRSKTSHATMEPGIRTSFIPEVLHDTLDAAIQAQIARSWERHSPGPHRAYGDGLYAEVELPAEPGERPGTVMTVTTGACFVNRCTPGAERAS